MPWHRAVSYESFARKERGIIALKDALFSGVKRCLKAKFNKKNKTGLSTEAQIAKRVKFNKMGYGSKVGLCYCDKIL